MHLHPFETLKKPQPGTIPAGGFTGIDTEKFKPQVAPESQLQTDAAKAAAGFRNFSRTRCI